MKLEINFLRQKLFEKLNAEIKENLKIKILIA